jgi:epoxyqueuosine reductase
MAGWAPGPEAGPAAPVHCGRPEPSSRSRLVGRGGADEHGLVPEVPDIDALHAVGTAHGLDVVGVTSAAPFDETRRHLEERKAAGLHGGMAFTYRRPERSTDPERALPGARAIVVGARGYLTDGPGEPDAPSVSGRIARYAWQDHYRDLREGLGAVAAHLQAVGWRARVVADDNALVDRAAAQRAGIGWFGKNANLLVPGKGSWFVLGGVITDAPLEAPGGEAADRCGTCTRCIDACPTGAITSPGVVDARLCLAWLLQAEGPFPRQHRVALGDRIYGCDECQDVCPINRRMPLRPRSSRTRPWAPLLTLLDPDDAVVLAWADRWYIPRREVRYVRRNALVVLGNVGDARDPDVVGVLEAHLRHDDPLLRAHAAWAAAAVGRRDLLTLLEHDADPAVRDEIEALTP